MSSVFYWTHFIFELSTKCVVIIDKLLAKDILNLDLVIWALSSIIYFVFDFIYRILVLLIGLVL